MGKTFWLLSTTAANFDITRRRGLSLQGIESRQRRKAVRIVPDDRIVYYLEDARRFAATVTVTSPHFEGHSRIWEDLREKEDFPHRVKIRADVVLDEEQYLDALQIGPRLEYVRKWAPEQWNLALLGALHIIPQKDFNLLEEEMRRVKSKGSRSGRRNRRRRRGRRQAATPVGSATRADDAAGAAPQETAGVDAAGTGSQDEMVMNPEDPRGGAAATGTQEAGDQARDIAPDGTEPGVADRPSSHDDDQSRPGARQ